MAIGVYEKGALIRLSAAFTVNSVATDPTAVTCKVVGPAGVITTLTATKDSVGNYHADFDLTNAVAGTYAYRFTGTGACQAAEESQFYVEASAF